MTSRQMASAQTYRFPFVDEDEGISAPEKRPCLQIVDSNTSYSVDANIIIEGDAFSSAFWSWQEPSSTSINESESLRFSRMRNEPSVKQGRGASSRSWSDEEIEAKLSSILTDANAESFESGTISNFGKSVDSAHIAIW